MKFLTNSLAKKMWLTVTAAIIITILYSYLLSYLFYEKIYVDNVRDSLLTEGRSLASEYHGGALTEDIRKKIEWYNSKSETEIFIVSNPRELSACLPFEIDYQTLIGKSEREELLKGIPVEKLGYEKRFDRNIMGVIIPLLDDNRLQGIIYLYVPLAKISEITRDFAYLWLAAAAVFTVISITLGTMLVKKLTRPLLDMKDAAEHVSQGNYDVHLKIDSKDEIGQLANAFNYMSSSIRKEDEKKREFLANVSHELRTPISYVKGYSEAIISGMEKSEEDRKKYLQLILRESRRMERLVGDLLDLSKLESDEYKLEKMPLPLAQLIEDAIEKYKPVLREKNVDLQYRLNPEVIINGDEGRIEQVIQNIMDNSIRYTADGRICIRLSQERDQCLIEIEDTGIGISEEHLSKIKQRFYRVNKGRTRSDGGTGLGLAIAEKLVKLHQGELTVFSELNKGTTVRIMLPLLELK